MLAKLVKIYHISKSKRYYFWPTHLFTLVVLLRIYYLLTAHRAASGSVFG